MGQWSPGSGFKGKSPGVVRIPRLRDWDTVYASCQVAGMTYICRLRLMESVGPGYTVLLWLEFEFMIPLCRFSWAMLCGGILLSLGRSWTI